MTLVVRATGGRDDEASKAGHHHEAPSAARPRPDAPAGAGAAAPVGAGAPATSDVPGLVPIDLPPERVQLIGIRTARVARDELAPEVHAVGYVAANEAGVVQVHARFSGWIQELKVARTGERVRDGDVLATIYSPTLLTTQQELLNARRYARADGASSADTDGASTGGRSADAHLQASLVQGARRRLELLGVGPEEIRAIERTGKPLTSVPLRAPSSGYVTEKNAVQGAYVEPETTLFQIADLATVWVLAEVYESELARVEVGAPATITLAAYPGEVFRGRVDYLYPTLDAATRTLRARLVFPNPDLRLRPGMYGDVTLSLSPTSALVVPRDAIVDTGDVSYVFVVRDGGRFTPRRVVPGARTGDRVAVRSGLTEGEVVVTTANFLLDSESRLHAAISGGSESGSAAPSSCDVDFDRAKFPDKYAACRACEVQHRGMGSMEDDCKRAIPPPWR
jgi:Cu(I)/Ag(I) efflux system membrane fusion protein